MAGSVGGPSDCEPSKVKLKFALSPSVIVSRSSDAVSCAAQATPRPVISAIPSNATARRKNRLRGRAEKLWFHDDLSISHKQSCRLLSRAQASVRACQRQRRMDNRTRVFFPGRLGGRAPLPRSVLGNRRPLVQAAAMSATAPIQQFLTAPGPPELGPGPRPGVRSQLELNTALEGLFRALKLQPPNQQLVRALVLLWHDHLDASHMISQGIENADGSFIHAIVHRREPDYSNAKYWWRRVGAHRCFPDIARRVAEWLKAKGEHDLAATLDRK